MIPLVDRDSLGTSGVGIIFKDKCSQQNASGAQDGARWDGARWNGVRWDGARWDGVRWDEVRRDGASGDLFHDMSPEVNSANNLKSISTGYPVPSQIGIRENTAPVLSLLTTSSDHWNLSYTVT